MTAGSTWDEVNSRYLAVSLDWLRARLDALGATPQIITPEAEPAPLAGVVVPAAAQSANRRRWSQPRPDEPTEAPSAPVAPPGPTRALTQSGIEITDEASVAELAALRADAAASDSDSGQPPALLQLAQRLTLSDFERDTLLLCAAPAIEPGIGSRIAAAQGDPAASTPTFALAVRLFDEPRWDVLSPERGLRRWHLVHAAAAPARPLLTAPLSADQRIADLIRGLNYLDEGVAAAVARLGDPAPRVELPQSTQQTVDQVVRAVLTETPDGRFPVVQLLGGDEASAQLVAVRAAAQLGCAVHQLRVATLVRGGVEADELATLWHRESQLLSVALLVDTTGAEAADATQVEAVRGLLARVGGPVFLAAAEVWRVPDRASVLVDVTRPAPDEQRDLWATATGLPADGLPTVLASQFRLGLPTVHQIATAVRHDLDVLIAADNAAATDDEVRELLWTACRTASRPRLETLARRVVPRARWADLVLPAEQLDLLRQLVGQVRHRTTVYSHWGFDQRSARGTGVTALFAGPSGTGKTYTGEVLAGELGLDLYCVDLASVVDKYIGETEKNLRRVFDAAEDGGALLFFDEADALFGRRSEVRDSHDRYANIEISYLLQRMESYDGIALLATNLRPALDPALLRRVSFVIDFPLPGPAERRRLWSTAIPSGVPVGEVDLAELAQLPVTGAAVRAIALGAAFLAAAEQQPVTTETLLRAARVEFRKLDLPVPAAVIELGAR